ncbi:MAG: hypothetical protein NTW12_10100 [Deltaproteobacteria bacterium]|nr:hypothetical protein [Deltaproteobacteria bacterium]
MGTLFKQPERNHRVIKLLDIEDFLENAIKVSKEKKVSVSDVIEAKKVLELQRKNDLYVENGDTHDEQMSGIGELLKELIQAIESINEAD